MIGTGGGLFVCDGKSYVNVDRSRIEQKFGFIYIFLFVYTRRYGSVLLAR